jgi:hydroxymethylpyrimidine/phosphomethylpyrimidine kinase
MRTALTIAGSDSSGGAGIQADLKTFAAFGVYGTSAITAITAQNTLGIQAMQPLSADLVTAQVEAIAGDIAIHATKIGMLATAAIVEAVAAAIKELELPLVVLDPVLVSTSGERLLDEDGIRALCAELIPQARVVTPNVPEAEVLSGIRIRSIEDAHEAAQRILRMGAAAVIITGGHAIGKRLMIPDSARARVRLMPDTAAANDDARTTVRLKPDTAAGNDDVAREVVDLLFDGHAFCEYRTARVDSDRTHGTGCTFASAVAAGLALGRTLPIAAEQAQRYVAGAIAHAPAIGHGRGPLDHFWGGILRR